MASTSTAGQRQPTTRDKESDKGYKPTNRADKQRNPQDVAAIGDMYTQLYQKDIESGLDNIKRRRGRDSPEKKHSVAKRVGFAILGFLARNGLVITVNISIGLAVLTTVALNNVTTNFSAIRLRYLNLIGTMYLNSLHCLLIPIIACSVIVSMARLDVRFLGSIGLATLLYVMCTSILSVLTGIVLVLTIRPGYHATGMRHQDVEEISTNAYVDTILDMMRSLFPTSLIEATMYYPQAIEHTETFKSDTSEEFRVQPVAHALCHQLSSTSLLCAGTNYPGMVLSYLIIGLTLGTIGTDNSFILFFSCLNDALLRILYCLVWISPIGIYFLTLSKMVSLEETMILVVQVSKFCLTVMGGICFHIFVTLPIVYMVVVHKLPFRLMFNLFDALVAGFATSSSVATLPYTLYCMEKKNHIPPIVTRFVIPLGATVNVDGSAFYEAVAPIFIAQLNHLHLSLTQVISISLTATLASMGTSGVPQAGLLNMAIALRSLNLPEEDVGLILAVDWILDRFRTCGNITGDAVGAAVVYHLCKEEIQKEGFDYEEDESDEIIKLFKKAD